MSTTGTERAEAPAAELTGDRLNIRAIEPAERQDDILELLQGAMAGGAERWVDRRLWEWKHLDNPFGRSLVLIAEAGDGRIAGLRAFMRWRFRSGESALEAYRPVDTATHPDFRRLGIFTRLTLQALERARQAGGDVIFNTPNSMSVSGYLKMGWTQVGVAGPSIKVRSHSLAALKLVNGRVGQRLGLKPKSQHSSETTVPAALQAENVITPDFERLIEQHRSWQQGLLVTDNSVSYLLWRYAENPLYKYAVVADRKAGALTGACIVRLAQGIILDTLVFEDFLVAEPSAQTVRRLVDMAFDAFKPDAGSAYAPPEATMSRVLGQCGFRWKSKSRINFVANPLKENISPAPGTFSNWAIGMSELEIF